MMQRLSTRRFLRALGLSGCVVLGEGRLWSKGLWPKRSSSCFCYMFCLSSGISSNAGKKGDDPTTLKYGPVQPSLIMCPSPEFFGRKTTFLPHSWKKNSTSTSLTGFLKNTSCNWPDRFWGVRFFSKAALQVTVYKTNSPFPFDLTNVRACEGLQSPRRPRFMWCCVLVVMPSFRRNGLRWCQGRR